MAKKQQPRRPAPPSEPAEAPPAEPIDELVQMLEAASERMQGPEGDEMRRHVGEVRHHVATLVEQLKERSQAAERSRKEAAAELEKLIAAVTETGAAAGRAIEAKRASIQQAFGGIEMTALAEGLHRFADWLANPSEAREADVKRAIEALEARIGPAIGWDPQQQQQAEDERRRAEIRAGVQASLDSIFRPKKPE